MDIKSRWLYVAVATPLLTLATTNMAKSAKTIIKEFGTSTYLLGRIDAHRTDGEILSRALNVQRSRQFLAENLRGDEFVNIQNIIETTQPEVLQPLEWQIAQRTLRDTIEDEREATARNKKKLKPKAKGRLEAIIENLQLFLSTISSKEVGA